MFGLCLLGYFSLLTLAVKRHNREVDIIGVYTPVVNERFRKIIERINLEKLFEVDV